MKIRLRLFATLQEYLPAGSGSEMLIELPDTTRIPDVLAAVGVPVKLAHIVFANGRHVLRPDLATHELRDNDVLSVFPSIGGG